jgi:CHAT domain-containing protein
MAFSSSACRSRKSQPRKNQPDKNQPDKNQPDKNKAAASSELSRLLKASCRRTAARLKPFGVDLIPLSFSRRLAKHTALLLLIRVNDRYERRAVWQGGMHRASPVSLSRAKHLVVTTRDSLEFGTVSDLRPYMRAGREATRQLLSSLISALPAEITHLKIVADGLLRFIPFHALPLARDTASKHRFVIERYAVTMVPCGGLRAALPLRVERASLIAPRYGGQVVRGTMLERKTLGSRFRLAPKAAERGAMLAALQKRDELVHFAGHAIADLVAGRGPELLFSRPKSVLRLRDLARVRVRAPLIVLASCTSAQVARFRGPHPRAIDASWPEVLLARGAQHVVAASWGVKRCSPPSS